MIVRHHLGQSGLGMPEWRLLAAVGRHGVLSPTSAGEETSMDKVKVSRAAASLVGRGLLRQSQDPDDGRGRLLRLTRKGTTIYSGIAPMAEEIEQSLSACLTRAERTVLHKALGKLIEHARNLMNGQTADLADEATEA
jgi:DNA-binding MarR family transcriptional regulator